MEQVEVTDSDRQRAVIIMSDRWNTVHQAQVLNGNADHWIPVRECALHRIEATRTNDQAKDEEIARLASIIDKAADKIDAIANTASLQDLPHVAEALDSLEFRMRRDLSKARRRG